MFLLPGDAARPCMSVTLRPRARGCCASLHADASNSGKHLQLIKHLSLHSLIGTFVQRLY